MMVVNYKFGVNHLLDSYMPSLVYGSCLAGQIFLCAAYYVCDQWHLELK